MPCSRAPVLKAVFSSSICRPAISCPSWMCPLRERKGSSSLKFTSLTLFEPKLNTLGAQVANVCSAEEQCLKATGVKTAECPRHATSKVRPRGSALNQTPLYHLYFPAKLKRHTDACHLRVPSESPSNYPGLSFAVRWHDPGAHAGLANCERKEAEHGDSIFLFKLAHHSAPHF